MHTVRLCRDSAGYFATLQPIPPAVRVYWSTQVVNFGLAVHVLGLAHSVAQGLTRREERSRLARAISGPPLLA